MLSRAAVKALITDGKLVPVKSLATWEAEPRAFLLTQELLGELIKGRADADEEVSRRWAKLEADMSHFVEGGYVNWGLMKWLDPKKQEVWELKSVRPKPSMRVFGRFAEPDVFIGTHIASRKSLQGKWSPEYWREIFICEEIWKSLTNDRPFSGKNYTDYITANADKRVRI